MSPKTDSVTIDDIRRAASVIAGHVVRTPAIPAPRLAEATGAKEVVLKLENLQYTGSFKDRGAYNKLASLDAKAKAAGVIAMSAGNHAQGVAHHAQRLGIPSTIVMPRRTTSCVGRPPTASPSRRTSPSLGTTIPRIVFSVVVFPLAFPPRRQTISYGPSRLPGRAHARLR